jgi:hypothetical protein
MIQAATTSLPGSPALGIGTPSASGDDAGGSGTFAKVLSSSMTPGQECNGDVTAASGLAAGPAAVHPSGKTAGKILPDLTGIAVPAETAADTSATDEPAPVLPRVTSEIVLPGLVLPAGAKPAQSARPAARPSTSQSLVRTAAAQLACASQPATIDGAPAPKPAKDSDKTDESPSAKDKGTPGAAFATPPAGPMQLVIQVAIPVPAQSEESDTKTLPTLAQPGAAPAGPLVAPVPHKEQSPTGATAASPASVPAPAVQTASAAEPVSVVVNLALPRAQATQAIATVQPTVRQLAALQPAALRPSAPATATAGATHVMPGTAIDPAAPATKKAMPAAAADVPADGPEAAPATSGSQAAPAAGAQLPPVIASAPSLTQTIAPVAMAPATGTTHVPGHDFTALVDRLVEAREAASPQTVHAAISHSEFGQVSLRFDQDASGLSVSMTSADPEFARAVQASAASAGPQTANDNGSAPRQNASGHHQQQMASSSSGQPQSQTQSQAYGRENRGAEARAEARPATKQNPETGPGETSGDIYA